MKFPLFQFLIIIQMNRNITISKETLDKVRLAKKYIEDKYQSIVEDQIAVKDIVKKIAATSDGIASVKNCSEKSTKEKSIQMRLLRQKITIDHYKLYSLIGRGAFGEVRLAEEISSGQLVAIKRLKKQSIAKNKQIFSAYIEKELMGSNHSQYIVSLKNAFQDEEYLYIVMQYVPGGDLLHLLIEKDIFSEEATRFYIAEMVLAIEEIHHMGYIHRDIKPDNILLDKNGHLKISDFGLSKYVKPGRTKGRFSKLQKLTKFQSREQKIFSKVGTPDYISPEVLTGDTYDQSIDIWGIGVIMFECLYGYPPFTDNDSTQVCCHVVNWLDYLEFPKDIKISTEARMLILGLINDRSRRLTIEQIKKHPFFQNFNWKNVHNMKPPYVPILKNSKDVRNFDKFQIQEPWTREERKLCDDGNKEKRMATKITEGDQNLEEEEQKKTNLFNSYSFAGFDFSKAKRRPWLQDGQGMQRNSYSHKPSHKFFEKSTKKINKKLKTQSFEHQNMPKDSTNFFKLKQLKEKSLKKIRRNQRNTITQQKKKDSRSKHKNKNPYGEIVQNKSLPHPSYKQKQNLKTMTDKKINPSKRLIDYQR